MAELAPTRVEPIMDPGPVSPPAAVDGVASDPGPIPAPTVRPSGDDGSNGLDQLFRIEEKTARIEEKYARTEALLQRVESKMDSAAGRMAESARQADLSAVREQVTALSRVVRNLPGLTALVSVAIVTSLLTAAITIALLKYGIPGLPPR